MSPAGVSECLTGDPREPESLLRGGVLDEGSDGRVGERDV